MLLVDLQGLLTDYSFHYFVSTSKVLEVNKDQLYSDMKESPSEMKDYFNSVIDLITHTHEFVSDNYISVRNYVLRLIGTTKSLKHLIQQCEDYTKIFENELSWARALAIRGMITILDNIIQQLTIEWNQMKNPRLVRKLRDKVCIIIWEKIPQIFNILSIIIAIEKGQSSASEIVDAIGNGIIVTGTS